MKRINTAVTIACILTITAGANLSACAKAGASMQRIGNDMHTEGVKMDRKVRSWFDSEGIGQPEVANRKPDTAYCYKSIGEVTCYDYPLVGEDSRLVGKQVPVVPAYGRHDVYQEIQPLPVDTMDPPATIGMKTLKAPGATPTAGPPEPGQAKPTQKAPSQAPVSANPPQNISPQVF